MWGEIRTPAIWMGRCVASSISLNASNASVMSNRYPSRSTHRAQSGAPPSSLRVNCVHSSHRRAISGRASSLICPPDSTVVRGKVFILHHSRFMSRQTALVCPSLPGPDSNRHNAHHSSARETPMGSLPIVRRIHDRAQLARRDTAHNGVNDYVGRHHWREFDQQRQRPHHVTLQLFFRKELSRIRRTLTVKELRPLGRVHRVTQHVFLFVPRRFQRRRLFGRHVLARRHRLTLTGIPHGPPPSHSAFNTVRSPAGREPAPRAGIEPASTYRQARETQQSGSHLRQFKVVISRVERVKDRRNSCDTPLNQLRHAVLVNRLALLLQGLNVRFKRRHNERLIVERNFHDVFSLFSRNRQPPWSPSLPRQGLNLYLYLPSG
nr:MAG TPA: hypothetical protein [Caudoviricetes sp.]